MIEFKKYKLENGLTLIVHTDDSTPLAAFNLLYDVGARDENPEKTGFAHLFEHLMFGGSANIPSYDEPLQRVGGENNAFTSNNITNYYITLPADNLETAFWLESDRMLELAFSEKSLEVQRNVVIEEFRQRYLNQPYGDAWLLLRPLAYKVHPYRWATIGKEVSHIENAVMQDVKDFFYTHYRPDNAILCVAGNVKADEVLALTEKWFGAIPAGKRPVRNLPQEPVQTEARKETVERDVPFDAIYKVFHIGKRTDDDYYAFDLLSDILSRGHSSRMYVNLVRSKKLFSDISASVTGDHDPGLFIISGKLMEGITMEEAEAAIDEELLELRKNPIPFEEMEKVKNKAESSHLFSEMSVLNKAMNLCFSELHGDAEDVNRETENYRKVSAEDLMLLSNKHLIESNSSTLYYLKKRN